MLGARLVVLFGALLLVGAKSVQPEPAEDDLDITDIGELFDDSDDEALRFRRAVDDEKETSDRESNSAEDPAPRSGESGECHCPHHHPYPPPPGHPCHGLTRSECREKMTPPPYSGPPCELRLFFRLPTDFNHTARKECFEKWEKPALEEKGVDFSKPPPKTVMRPHFHRTLMIHKGCDSQCMFLENKLVVEEDGAWVIAKDAVMDALKEDDDTAELTDVFEEHIKKCIEEAGELVHPKQSCKSGSDEFLACIRFNINNACPGAKWKGNRSCTDVEDSTTKIRNCRREQRSIFMERFRHGMKGFRPF